MKALGTFFFCTIVLVSLMMGSHGEADVLVYALTALSFCVFVSAYFVLSATGSMLSVRIPSVHEFKPDDTSELNEASRLLGRALPLGDTRIIDLQLGTRYIYRILGGFLLGVLLGWFLHVVKSPHKSVLDIVLAELATIICMLRVMKPCVEFFAERHLLHDSATTLAANYSLRLNPLYSGAWYSFIDEHDLFRGGTCRLFRSDWSQGELAVVFYDKTDPDRNIANFGLHYHVLLWPAASVASSAVVTT
jgi:hypothetical protein